MVSERATPRSLGATHHAHLADAEEARIDGRLKRDQRPRAGAIDKKEGHKKAKVASCEGPQREDRDSRHRHREEERRHGATHVRQEAKALASGGGQLDACQQYQGAGKLTRRPRAFAMLKPATR